MNRYIAQFLIIIIAVLGIAFYASSQIIVEGERLSGTIPRLPVLKTSGNFLIPRTSGRVIGSSTVPGYFSTATSSEDFCLEDGTCLSSASGLPATAFTATSPLTIATTSTTVEYGASLTLGYVYAGNASNIPEATSSIFIKSNGNVGIGNASPDGKVDALSSGIANIYKGIASTGSGQWRVREHSGGSVRMSLFDTSGNEDIQLNPNGNSYIIGNVGIGTTTPYRLLSVAGKGVLTDTLTVGAYTLPTADGALTGYVLKTDALGTLTWQEDLTGVVTSGVTFYFDDQLAEFAGYERLSVEPSLMSETAETATSVNQFYGIIDPYISTTTGSAGIVIDSLPAGTYSHHVWASVNSAVGDSRIIHQFYARDTGGTERFLFQSTSTELTTAVVGMTYIFTTTASSTFTDERLVIKNYCWTDRASENTCTIYYGGNERYSHIDTPLSIDALDYTRSTNAETITGEWTHTGLLTLGDLGVTTATATNFSLTAWLKDENASTGTAGQVLSTTNTGIDWVAGATAFDTIAELNAFFVGNEEVASTTASNANFINDAGYLVVTDIDSIANINSNLSGESVASTTQSNPSYSYATSTTWTGTTTRFIKNVSKTEVYETTICLTDGTLDVVFSDGTNDLDLINASSTKGTFTYSTNNIFTAGDTIQIEIGNPGSTPTYIVCTPTIK